MSNKITNGQISIEQFTNIIRYALTETFESVHGIYLDKSTSLFETLATISAEEASIPVGEKCATLAAQVEHIRFYLDVLEQYMLGSPPENVDLERNLADGKQRHRGRVGRQPETAARDVYTRFRRRSLRSKRGVKSRLAAPSASLHTRPITSAKSARRSVY